MKITITEKGIKPQDVFKIVEDKFNFIAMNQDGEWRMFFTNPYYVKTIISHWLVKNGAHRRNLHLKIDYDGKPEDSLFCRVDL